MNPGGRQMLSWAYSLGNVVGRVLLITLFLSSPSIAQNWKWSTETVDGYGSQASIAVDQDQNIHLSYFSGVVKYAFKPVDSHRWFTMDVAEAGGYKDLFTRLALDSKGNPHICFTPGVLKYAEFENGRWRVQQIDPQSGLIDYSCSLAIAADGTPHVSWYQYGSPEGGYYLHLKYAVLLNGEWMARTVDFEGQTGKWNSLVLDKDGNPHLSYDSFLKGEMKYAAWNGKDWIRSIIDSPGISPKGPDHHGMGNSLVLNKDGQAAISYEDDHSIKYAWQRESSWKLDVVDSITTTGSWAGYRTRQVLDLQGRPHIVYESGGSVKHAHWDGSTWTIQQLSGPGPYRHRFEDIAMDRDGNIYVVYQDGLDGSLKVEIGRAQPRAAEQNAQSRRGE